MNTDNSRTGYNIFKNKSNLMMMNVELIYMEWSLEMFSWAGTESKAEIRPINFRTNIFDGKEP
jgi:hypothetical protein